MIKSEKIREIIAKNAPIVLDEESDNDARNKAAQAIITASKPLIRYALSPVGYKPPITREEIEAECQNEIFLNLSRISNARNPSAYIISVCRHFAYKYVAKNKQLPQADASTLEDIADTEEASTDWLDDFENEALANYVRTLPKDAQKLLYDVFVNRKSVTEIAMEKGVNKSTVSRKIKQLLSAAQQNLP